jgi:hypothetical protein
VNLKVLGDALDHWKGSICAFLREGRVLQDFAIDAMVSDPRGWTRRDQEVFARVLRVSVSELIQHHASLNDREAYFGEISHSGDLFLDPDIGIAIGKRVKNRKQYVLPAEISSLLGISNGRLLTIYQHVRGQKVVHRVDQIVGMLETCIGEFGWCSYESGGVAMLFFSRDTGRINSVADCFKNLLGHRAEGRIRSSTASVAPHPSRVLRRVG